MIIGNNYNFIKYGKKFNNANCKIFFRSKLKEDEFVVNTNGDYDKKMDLAQKINMKKESLPLTIGGVISSYSSFLNGYIDLNEYANTFYERAAILEKRLCGSDDEQAYRKNYALEMQLIQSVSEILSNFQTHNLNDDETKDSLTDLYEDYCNTDTFGRDNYLL